MNTYYNKTSFDKANLLDQNPHIVQSQIELTPTGATVVNTNLPVTYIRPTVTLTKTGAIVDNSAAPNSAENKPQ